MEDDKKVVMLSQPIKQGILRLVFSRVFIFALVVILQIALMVTVYTHFTEKMPILLTIQWIFAFIMTVYLFNSESDASSKLTWMLVISILPFAGAAMLFWTKLNFGHRLESELVKKEIQNTRNKISQSDAIMKEVEKDGSGTDDVSKYLSKSG